MPPDLFYPTSANTCILVAKRIDIDIKTSGRVYLTHLDKRHPNLKINNVTKINEVIEKYEGCDLDCLFIILFL